MIPPTVIPSGVYEWVDFIHLFERIYPGQMCQVRGRDIHILSIPKGVTAMEMRYDATYRFCGFEVASISIDGSVFSRIAE